MSLDNVLKPEDVKARFPECYDFTRRWEGGYVDHPSDPGGCTNKGVTLKTLERHRGRKCTCQDVRNLSDEEAAEIYADGFWARVWGNKLPVGLNLCVWDWGVNSGPRRSVKALQKLVGSAADGAIGPNTLKAVEAYVAKHGIEMTIRKYTRVRQNYYESLKTFKTFGRGWTNRNTDCHKEALRLAKLGPK